MERKYVVYTHNDEEGNVRYVGSGTLQRANMTNANANRGVKYKTFVLEHGKLTVSIIYSGLSKVESLEIEKEIYLRYAPSGLLLNFAQPRVLSIPIDSNVLDNFEYSENSPSKLVWKIGKKNLGFGSTNSTKVFAGSLNKRNYWIVKLNTITFKVHRIIFKLLNPLINIDDLVVDHIDRDPSNNCKENLRAITYAENSRNRSKSGLKELPMGVKWSESQSLYTAHYCDPSDKYLNGAPRLIQKHFNVNKIGSHEEALKLAIEWRKNALMKLNLDQNLGYILTD